MTKNYLMLNFHENDEKMKNFMFLEKVAGSLGKAPGGLRRPPGAPRQFFEHGIGRLTNSKKFTEECFAQHVDGAPSTAPSSDKVVVRSTLSVNLFGSKNRPAGGK